MSTTAFCRHCNTVREIVAASAATPIPQREPSAAYVKARLDCGHKASLVMSTQNIDAVRGASV